MTAHRTLKRDTLRRVLAWLTGGRPMQCDGINFTDVVSGEKVLNWRDFYGREWMATNRWGWFRVRLNAHAQSQAGGKRGRK